MCVCVCVTCIMIVVWRRWMAHGLRLPIERTGGGTRDHEWETKSMILCMYEWVCLVNESVLWVRDIAHWTDQFQFKDCGKIIYPVRINLIYRNLHMDIDCVSVRRRWWSVNPPEQQPKREVQFFCLMFGFVRTTDRPSAQTPVSIHFHRISNRYLL